MEYGSIERELQIDAAPDVVFEVLSSPEYIRQWWSAETEIEASAGTTGTLTWTDESSGNRQSTALTVVEANRPHRFAFRWTHGEDEIAAAGNSMLVTFDLLPDGDGTTVRFRETGFRERGWEAAVLEERYNDHRQGWDFYLPRVVETAHRLATAR